VQVDVLPVAAVRELVARPARDVDTVDVPQIELDLEVRAAQIEVREARINLTNA